MAALIRSGFEESRRTGAYWNVKSQHFLELVFGHVAGVVVIEPDIAFTVECIEFLNDGVVLLPVSLALVVLINALIVLASLGGELFEGVISEILRVFFGEANCSEQGQSESEMHFNYYKQLDLILAMMPVSDQVWP